MLQAGHNHLSYSLYIQEEQLLSIKLVQGNESLSPDDTLRKGHFPLVLTCLGVCYPFKSTLHVFFVLFQEIEANKEMLARNFEKISNRKNL